MLPGLLMSNPTIKPGIKMAEKKTILLCAIGSAGDVNPFLAIGQELVNRGFRVFLITSAYFEARARAVGLEFFPLGRMEDYHTTIQNPDLWDPQKGFKFFGEKVVLPIVPVL